jgi:hypothetical protein
MSREIAPSVATAWWCSDAIFVGGLSEAIASRASFISLTAVFRFCGLAAPPLASALLRAGPTRSLSSGPSFASYAAFDSGCELVVEVVGADVVEGVDEADEVDFFDDPPQPATASTTTEPTSAARDDLILTGKPLCSYFACAPVCAALEACAS